MHWSYDGTSFISVHEDFGIRLFLLPPDILDRQDKIEKNNQLVPFLRIYQNMPILSYSPNSLFSLYGAENEVRENNNILVSLRGVPLRLVDLSPKEEEEKEEKSSLISQYYFKDIMHDKFLDTTALNFLKNGKFLAGSTNNIALFDINRSIPIWHKIFKKTGIISCLEKSKSNSLIGDCIFFGSYIKNQINILDTRSRETVMKSNLFKQGNGIQQIIESNNGRFLYSIARSKDDIDILDLRMNLMKVGTLTNWKQSCLENKNQKKFVDILPNSQGIIAGSNNGEVKIWENSELGIDCDCEVLFKINDNNKNLKFDPNISCVKVNPLTDVNIIGITNGERDPIDPLDSIDSTITEVGLSGISLWETKYKKTL
ncbi:hypothetical protein PACTADRAFT_32213 [Pachysolen tannophilus NRRL Y-2460]|uniref:Protein SWT21 n=1 Tax=Pachysolen tannophilus NRRL Y-2460 TaxID=669874 RepID=A0A1E4TY90_PACTA|nr:hypothetical protein PACTADRAFT_32213 [Pachysolen tannophilus NRRL Y-2460]